MKQRRLGTSGLYVSALSLGTMIFGEEGIRSTPEEEAIRMIHAYLDHGGTHIDTANTYANGRSEEIIGRALSDGRRKRTTIATKVRFGTNIADDMGSGLSRKVIMEQAEASLRKMRTDVIDLYYMHGWDPHTPIEESLRAFDDLVQAGKVRYIGVSNFRAWQVMKSLGLSARNGWARFVAAQYQYSLIVRDIEYEFRGLLQSEGIGLMPWGPLGGGFLSGKYAPDARPSSGRIADTGADLEEAWDRRATGRNWRILEVVQRVAQDHNATVAQVALAWTMAQAPVSSVILGARTMKQLEDNLGACEISLAAHEIDALNDASRLPELYPYRMMAAFGMGE